MFKLTLKSILARKGRLLLTSLAVILGTSFLAGTFIFSDTLTKSFDDLFADVFEDTDAYVRSSVVIEGDFGAEERQRIPDTLTGRRRPGARRSHGRRQCVRVRPRHRQGRQADRAPMATARRRSVRRSTEDEAFWTISEGRLPPTADEVVLDTGRRRRRPATRSATRSRSSPRPGRASSPWSASPATATSDSPGGATFALFDLATAQEFVGRPGFIDAVVVAR